MPGSPLKAERLARWLEWSSQPEAILELCEAMADGANLTDWCRAMDFAYTTVFRWAADDTERANLYARARSDRADKLADEIIAISDDGFNDTYKDAKGNVVIDHDVVARSRLRVDSRKWLASKLRPGSYGDKITTEVSGPGGAPIAITSTAIFDADALAMLGKVKG